MAEIRLQLIPKFQAGAECPTDGECVLVFSAPERTKWSWKDEYIRLSAEHMYGEATKRTIAKATKAALKIQAAAPKEPCPTINVEPNPRFAKPKTKGKRK